MMLIGNAMRKEEDERKTPINGTTGSALYVFIITRPSLHFY